MSSNLSNTDIVRLLEIPSGSEDGFESDGTQEINELWE